MAGLLRRRLGEERTVIVPSLDAISTRVVLHPVTIEPSRWIIACVESLRTGEVLAATELLSLDRVRHVLELGVLMGTSHDEDLAIEVRAPDGLTLACKREGRRVAVSGFTVGAEHRFWLAWPGGASLPVRLRVTG